MTLDIWTVLFVLVVGLVLFRYLAWGLWRAARVGLPKLWKVLLRLESRQRFWSGVKERWPRVARAVGARLDPRRFTGLPLTLVVAAGLYLVSLGAGLLDELHEGQELAAVDAQINSALSFLRGEEVVFVFHRLTRLGGLEALIAVSMVSLGFLWAHRRGVYIPGLLVTIIGSQVLTWIGKYALARERPDFITEAIAHSPSFPSAHTTGAVAVYGFLAYAIARELVGARRRFEIIFWTGALIVLIAFSRMLLSVHFASDIAAGFVVGGFWLLAGFAVTEYLRVRREAPQPSPG